MEIFNSISRFGIITIILHWLSAILVVTLFTLGLWMVNLDYYDPNYQTAPDLHKSLGITFFLILIVRVLFRLWQVSPRALSHSTFENKLAKTIHIMMYLLMLMIPVSGYLISTGDGRGIMWFGLLEVPAPSATSISADLAGNVHLYLAWMLITLVSLHALAGLKHWLIDKDKTLQRMFGLKSGK